MSTIEFLILLIVAGSSFMAGHYSGRSRTLESFLTQTTSGPQEVDFLTRATHELIDPVRKKEILQIAELERHIEEKVT